MRIKSIIPLVILITASLFFGACDGDGIKGSYITFTFDDIKYSWTKGAEGTKTAGETTIVYDGSVSGSILSSSENDDSLMTMAFPAAYVVSSDASTDFPQNAIILMLTNITGPGVYTYTASGNSQVMIIINDTKYSLTGNGVDSLELKITDIDKIGGYISGSFTATVTDQNDDESQHTITNGKFKIKRIEDIAYLALLISG